MVYFNSRVAIPKSKHDKKTFTNPQLSFRYFRLEKFSCFQHLLPTMDPEIVVYITR
jgi:hypothetical protein